MSGKKQRRDSKLEALRQRGALHPYAQKVVAGLFQEQEFFDARDLVQVKYEMLRSTCKDNNTVSESAKAFGLSRPSFYSAQSAFRKEGLPGLLPKKRGPRSGYKLTREVVEYIEEQLIAEPSMSMIELAEGVAKKFKVTVHPRSIERVLRRRGKKE